MSADRRLVKLEGNLPPQAAVLLWLAEVHEHGSLDAYMAWLLDQPSSKAPSIVITERARAAARSAHAGEPRSVVRGAERRATMDAVFLFMLVLVLEHVAIDTIAIGRLRLAALHWESRARTAESAADPRGWTAWRTGVLDLATDLARSEAVRRSLGERFLDGRAILSPDTVAAWRELRDDVTALVAAAPTLPGGRRRRHDRDIAREVERSAAEEARTLLERIRARTLDMLGDHAGALAIVERGSGETRQGPEHRRSA